jgi:serpin B
MKRIILLALGLLLLVSACTNIVPESGNTVKTDKGLTQLKLSEPKPLLPERFDPEDASYLSAAESSNAFGLKTAEKLLCEDENLLYSPYSAYLALSCVSAAASGEAKEQLNEVLNPKGMTDEDFHIANAILLGLALDDYAKPLEIATLVCADDELSLNKDFAQNALDNYRGETASVDFGSPSAREAINDWVSKKTKGLIPNVLDSEPAPETVLVLANSLYFSGRWDWEFDPDDTSPLPFKGTRGETEVPFMIHTGEQSYYEDDSVQAIRMSFVGGSSMTVLLPREGVSVRDVIGMLSDGFVDKTDFSAHKGTLKLPKFKTDTKHDLAQVLKDLGMTVMFDGSVNSFGGLIEERIGDPIYISSIFQKAYIEVDEKGTTAAAVTVIEAPASDMPPTEEPPPFEMTVDRPFVFLLTQRAGAGEVILFVGAINNINEE